VANSGISLNQGTPQALQRWYEGSKRNFLPEVNAMSSTETDLRTGLKKSASEASSGRDTEELTDQIDAIRADIQTLTSTVGRIANRQFNRAQDKAIETANDAEEAIRKNPISAVAIAVGLGFVFGAFIRR
jgi:ElaB/YqjD/DUF883 family membrane-anchored ribosome-binding protein